MIPLQRPFASDVLESALGQDARAAHASHDSDQWMRRYAVTPRDALPWLERSWHMRRVDDAPVWSISCFYVRKDYRRQGVTRLLIDAALEAAKHARAPALEAYPLDRALSPSATSTGIVSTFARADFRVVARHAPERPITRYEFKPPKAQR